MLWHHKGSLLASGIFFFRVRVELICWEDSRLCHWATGRRGLDNMSAQCLSWFPAASQPRKILPMASFRVIASWSQTEITRLTLCGQREQQSKIKRYQCDTQETKRWPVSVHPSVCRETNLNLIKGHIKDKGLIVIRIQSLLFDRCLLFLPLSLVQSQLHFYIRVYEDEGKEKLLYGHDGELLFGCEWF